MILFWIIAVLFSAWRSYFNFNRNNNLWGYICAGLSGVSLMELVVHL